MVIRECEDTFGYYVDTKTPPESDVELRAAGLEYPPKNINGIWEFYANEQVSIPTKGVYYIPTGVEVHIPTGAVVYMGLHPHQKNNRLFSMSDGFYPEWESGGMATMAVMNIFSEPQLVLRGDPVAYASFFYPNTIHAKLDV